MKLAVLILVTIHSVCTYGFSLYEPEDCIDFTVGDCTISPDSIVLEFPTDSVPMCQETCRELSSCMLFSHNGSSCFLLSQEYRKACGDVGAPVDAPMDTCQDAMVESCSGFDEENCEYLGESVGADPPNGEISDPLLCQKMCDTFSGLGCNFWVYKDKEESCQLLKSSVRKCTGISGPRAPPIDDCGFWGTTTSEKTNISSTTMTPTTTTASSIPPPTLTTTSNTIKYTTTTVTTTTTKTTTTTTFTSNTTTSLLDCITNNNGPKKNVPCVFPFKVKDDLIHTCTFSGGYSTPWCATQVDSDGFIVSGEWGECPLDDPNCPNDGTTTVAPTHQPGDCITVEGGNDVGWSCVFPFTTPSGVTHRGCTFQGGYFVPWCATVLDGDGVMLKRRWGNCPMDDTKCPIEDLEEE